MGYQTYHSLSVLDNKLTHLEKETQEHEILISKLILEDDNGDLFQDCFKWYDSDKDMTEYSLNYPDLIFLIHGQGEENEDMWDTYYKNGKLQHCPAVITYAEYDESKLIPFNEIS